MASSERGKQQRDGRMPQLWRSINHDSGCRGMGVTRVKLLSRAGPVNLSSRSHDIVTVSVAPLYLMPI